MPDDLNAWAEKEGALWKWEAAASSPQPKTAKPDATPTTLQQSLTTGEIAKAFSGLYYESLEKWLANLQDSRTKWLMDCQTRKPIKGPKGQPARWNPVAIADSILERAKAEAKEQRMSELNTRFRTEELLKPFGEMWKEAKLRRHD